MAYTNVNGRGLGAEHAVMVSRQQGADCRLTGSRPSKARPAKCNHCGARELPSGERAVMCRAEGSPVLFVEISCQACGAFSRVEFGDRKAVAS